MRLSAGRRLAHYEIIAPLGAGGMGEVYRATDTNLGRDVALKVLPAAMAADADRLARFRREARAVAALNHPHIVTIHSVERDDGIHFFTMELVEGQSLDRLIAEGDLSLDTFLQISAAIAGALAAAHDKGIVHRDLKPANVMVTVDGRVKVLDFGLAKVAAEAAGAEMSTEMQTREGVVMGTVPYMSPEQIVGRPVDHRTDLFSLGVMLYEMASGRRPFQGGSSAEVASAILRDTPRPLEAVRMDWPPALGAIVARCLQKEPGQRIQTAHGARDALVALRRQLESGGDARPSLPQGTLVSGFGGRPAIAVLPFDNRSGDPEQEFFAEGLAEDLITRLSLWRSFPVIARQSSFAYRSRGADLKQVSAELGVRYVVQGSVRKSGERVRIAAQLVDAATGQNVWTQTYDRVLTDVFAAQDEISEAIAASLVADLNRAEHALLTGSAVVTLANGHAQPHAARNFEAWGLYQRALAFFYRFTREDFAQARALLERAVELDPQFSTAWARLAETGMWEIIYGWTGNPDQTIAHALAQARRAVAIDPRDAEAHAELAFVLMTAGEGYAAIEEARRGTELNPSHPWALLIRAYVWHMTGNPPDESIDLVMRAMRLSPRDPAEWLFYDVLGGAYFNAGRFAEGLAAGRRLVSLWPGYYFGHLWCAMNAMELGQTASAEASIREARRVLPEVTLDMVRRVLGAMAPDVDRRMMGALQRAGLD
jgi:serine/threonine protein kinase/cytochrome c-type biogenesis protein CcmH/NrfG